jgi:YggT family protein
MSNHAIDLIETWVQAFADVYTILIIAWLISSWVRLPYNVWIGRARTFLDDTVTPYVGIFRRWLPMFGPLDLSPMVALIVLQVVERILISVLDGFRPAG